MPSLCATSLVVNMEIGMQLRHIALTAIILLCAPRAVFADSARPVALLAPSPDGPRGTDAGGSGEFLAPRGDRRHHGFDILTQPGADIIAPIDGSFTKYGFCYGDDPQYRYIELRDGEGLEVRIFYVLKEQFLTRGANVRAGEVIGRSQAISNRYGSRVQDHIHVEVRVNGTLVNPAPLLK